MYCEKCGAKIPEGNSFCESCGSPVIDEKEALKPDVNNLKETLKPDVNSAKGRRKIIAFIVAAALILGVGMGALVGYLANHSSAKYSAKIETAQKYVSDGNVDAAVKAYEEAIEIKPKKETAYLELADVYISQDDYFMAVDVLKRGYENTGSKKSFEKPINTAQVKLDDSWRAAYIQILEGKRSLIEEYETDYRTERSVALEDLNGDDIPEMLFFADTMPGFEDFPEFKAFTFRSGKATSMPINVSGYSLSGVSEEKSEYMPNWEGGPKYVIFTEKDTGRMVIHTTYYADPGFCAVSNEIEIDKDGKATELQWMMGYIDGVDYNTAKIKPDAYIEYGIDGKEISEQEYRKNYEALRDTMDKVLFVERTVEGEDGDRIIPPDEQKIWDMASQKRSVAVSCEKALESLRSGMSGDDKKEASKIESISVEDIPQREALTAFLQRFSWYQSEGEYPTGNVEPPREYDCRHAKDYPIMENIVANGSCANLDLYPGTSEEHWNDGTSDPRGRSKVELQNYLRVSEDKADWIATNIFNVSKADLDTIKKKLRGDTEKVYLQDGSYYRVIGGVGGPDYNITYQNPKRDGKKYYIQYTCTWPMDTSTSFTYYTTMELKKIDGKEYWSMYDHSSTPGENFGQ